MSYLEGCTAPMRDENQLHAAVVELVALDGAQIKYSTVQNWYPGDKDGKGGHLQLRHQAGQVPRRRLEDLLDPGGDGLGHHLEIPQLHTARRSHSVGEFYSVALTNNLPAGRHRHQDDPHGQEHPSTTIIQGYLRRPRPKCLSRTGAGR